MTEAEWLASTDLTPMLDLLSVNTRGVPVRASERKLRLFAVACCRRIWPLLTDERSRRAVEIAERFVDGLATLAEVGAARRDANDAYLTWKPAGPHDQAAYAALFPCSREARHPTAFAAAYTAYAVGDLLREVFGNPFRPVSLDPACLAWEGGTVVRLAQAAYDNRTLPCGTLSNDRLAVLADALEEAGCTDPGILRHCRQPGGHVRGCWVLDTLLGKS
jgi:hypothetical protein